MEISDPKAIRALAHPLRLDLIELLGTISPATAARCGRVLGVSQASCSFHLRQLARYGFVEDAGLGRDRRERLWRLTDRRLRLAPEHGLDPTAARQLGQILTKRETERILDYLQQGPGEPVEWRHAAIHSAATVPLTTTDLADIKEQWSQVLAPYLAKADANGARLQPGQRFVRFFLAASPLPDLDLGDSENETDT
ncbi:ArsR/SmtB family transcription factor [Streptomyces sp. NBC_01262]|uniref:ArsR/SmtB family transcription factor n=1 Tax=Streptomyces sp. NBC_01262 TaxID=2903803 RepID=UPI002E3688CA|nr:helix-turn-helix domain-containing protein [Streptomyces sp. NBC_01262]